MIFAQKTLNQNRIFFLKLILLIGLMSLGLTFQASAQRDLLVTQAGEEIRCRILDETPTRFIYAYVSKGEKVLRNEIFKNLVTSFKYNYYDTDLVKSDKLPGSSKREGGKAERVDTRKSSSSSSKKSKRAERKEAEELESLNQEKLEKEENTEPKIGGREKKADKKEEDDIKTSELEKEAIAASSVPKEIRVSPEVAQQLDMDKPAEELSKKELKKQAKELEKEAKQSEDIDVIDELSKKEKRELDKEAKKLEKLEEEKLEEEKTVQLENAELLSAPEQDNEFKNYLKFRVGVRGGLSNVINNTLETTNAYDLYREKLNKGWTFGADAAYFITEGIGIGAMFSNFMTNNSADGLTYPNLVSQVMVDNGSIATNISNKYVGPVLYLRKGIDFKTFVVLGLSPGMNFYNETGNYNGDNFDFKARQFGGAATLGLDFLLGNDIIGRDIILSLEAGYNYSRFNELNYGSIRGMETLASPLIMDRLDFSVGLRFMRFPKYLKLSSY